MYIIYFRRSLVYITIDHVRLNELIAQPFIHMKYEVIMTDLLINDKNDNNHEIFGHLVINQMSHHPQTMPSRSVVCISSTLFKCEQ